MFGIIYALFNIIGATVSGTGTAIEEHQCIERAKEKKRKGHNSTNTYIDRKGSRRDLDTGELRYVDYIGSESYNNDQCIRDIHGNVVRNLSQERRDAAYEEARNNPAATVYFWKHGIAPYELGRNGNPYYLGDIYMDVHNRNLYVRRILCIEKAITGDKDIAGTFYMNVNTGLLTRECDEQVVERNNGEEVPTKDACRKFITYFNQLQSDTGYIPNTKYPKSKNETQLEKVIRLGNYYLNNKSW